jgi:uncharacterized protein with ParB-like and HNH nuclease domain
MDCNSEALPLGSLHDLHERINTSPDYQRPAVWSKKLKQLLIDTILRGSPAGNNIEPAILGSEVSV